MAGSHVAHDCKLGDRITLGTGSMLAGHVHIEDWVYVAEGVAGGPVRDCGTSVRRRPDEAAAGRLPVHAGRRESGERAGVNVHRRDAMGLTRE